MRTQEASELRHRRTQRTCRKRHVREQPLVRGLPQREVEAHVLDRDAEALAEGVDVARQQRRLRVAGEGDADVGRAHDVGGERRERLAELVQWMGESLDEAS